MLVKKLIEENVLDATPREFKPGERLFTAGTAPDFIYYLLNGKARLVGKNGQDELQVFIPGSMAGLADILNDKHFFSAVVTESTQAMVVRRNSLLQLVERNPALRVYFLKLLSKGVVQASPMFE